MSTATLFEMGAGGTLPATKKESLPRTKPTKQHFSQEDIHRIYQAYPRHKEPGSAYVAIEAALNRIDAEDPVAELLAIVQQYREAREGTEPKYTPYPARWFNKKRYLEDPKDWNEDA